MMKYAQVSKQKLYHGELNTPLRTALAGVWLIQRKGAVRTAIDELVAIIINTCHTDNSDPWHKLFRQHAQLSSSQPNAQNTLSRHYQASIGHERHNVNQSVNISCPINYMPKNIS